MKSVLISIRPKWCEKIASGKKTIEVRKSRPKIETPFKCYIYMSQGDLKDLGSYSEWIYKNRMKVIGEFVCDRIEPLTIVKYKTVNSCWDKVERSMINPQYANRFIREFIL